MTYGRINDAISRCIIWLAQAIVAFVVLALFGGSVVRYFTGTGYDWVLELPPQLMPWLVFPMIGVLLRREQHVTVDALPAFLSGSKLAALRLFALAVSLFGCLFFAYAGADALAFFIELGQVAQTEISFPLWYLYLSFPFGFALAANFCLEALLHQYLAGDGAHPAPLTE